MKITSVNVRKIEKDGSRMKGIASVLLDDSFAVHDIRIIEGDNGLFIAMPSRKTATGGYRDIAHPINPEVRAMFEEAILDALRHYKMIWFAEHNAICVVFFFSIKLCKKILTSGVEHVTIVTPTIHLGDDNMKFIFKSVIVRV